MPYQFGPSVPMAASRGDSSPMMGGPVRRRRRKAKAAAPKRRRKAKGKNKWAAWAKKMQRARAAKRRKAK